VRSRTHGSATKKNQTRSGMLSRCEVAKVRGCEGAGVRRCRGASACGAMSATAAAKSSFAGTGRADSIDGQSAMPAADSDGPNGDSCEGQCGLADSECAAGSRHVASHHARAGAAAPMSNAMTRIDNRFTMFSIPAGSRCLGSARCPASAAFTAAITR